MATTNIQWSQNVWNPVAGCLRVSPGCGGGAAKGPNGEQGGCYAETMAGRIVRMGGYEWIDGEWRDDPKKKHAPGARRAADKYKPLVRINKAGEARWTGVFAFDEEKLAEPLSRKAPTLYFVNSMSDLFGEGLTNEQIDQVFAVMTLADWHTYQVLTKRADRMLEYMTDPQTPHRVARTADRLAVREAMGAMGEERILPIEGYPCYSVSDHGHVYSSNGSSVCLFCGGQVEGPAHKRYCSRKCVQNAQYHRRRGRPDRFQGALARMTPDEGEDGHLRVMLYRDGEAQRELVHRLVLSAFDRAPVDGEQGCHRDGDPRNNALPNLRWGTQAENWDDRRRHGNGRSYAKLTDEQVAAVRAAVTGGKPVVDVASDFGVSDTQVRNIMSGRQWARDATSWPPKALWLGVSCERQEEADERVPLLLRCPAAVRWVSAEPLLGPLNLSNYLDCGYESGGPQGWIDLPSVDWVVGGGESGHGARPCDVVWLRGLARQCKAAGTPYFNKQLGAMAGVAADGPGRLVDENTSDPWLVRDKKGADPAEWPKDLRVREWPRGFMPPNGKKSLPVIGDAR